MTRAFVFLTVIVVSFSMTAQDLPRKNGKGIVFAENNGFRFIDEESEYYTENGSHFIAKTSDHGIEDYRLQQVQHPSRILFTAVGGGLVYEFDQE